MYYLRSARTDVAEGCGRKAAGVPSAKRRQQVLQNQSMQNRSKKPKPYLVSPIFAIFNQTP